MRIYSTPVNGEDLVSISRSRTRRGHRNRRDRGRRDAGASRTFLHGHDKTTCLRRSTGEPRKVPAIWWRASFRGDIRRPTVLCAPVTSLHYLPEPQTYAEALAFGRFSSRAMSRCRRERPTTIRRLSDVVDQRGRRHQPCYYFQVVTSPNLIWLEIGDLDFSEGAPVLNLIQRPRACSVMCARARAAACDLLIAIDACGLDPFSVPTNSAEGVASTCE